MEVVFGTTLRPRSGEVPVSIRWILIQDPRSKLNFEALDCTNLDPLPIVNRYVLHSEVEVTAQGARAHKGMKTPHKW